MTSLKVTAIASASVLLLAMAGAMPVQAQQVTKKVVLTNVDPAQGVGPEGMETVNGVPWAAIPFQGEATLDAKGNLLINCAKDPLSLLCPNIGTGSGSATAPNLTFGTLADPIPDPSPPGTVLTWTSNGAVCYGKQVLKDGVAYTATGWEKSWPANTTTTAGSTMGYALSTLPRSTTAVTEYKFPLECHSAPASTGTGTSVIAIRQEVATVKLAKAEATSNSCSTYLATLSQAERDRYYAYLPENRGFQRVEETLTSYAGQVLGVWSGFIQDGVPRGLLNGQYRALSFSLPAGKKVTIELKKETFGTPAIWSNLTYSISPCPGDFRPFNDASSDVFLSACRTDGLVGAYNARIRTPGTQGAGYCNIETGRTYYFNVSRQNSMLDPGSNPQSPVPVPPAVCEAAWSQCGQSMTFKNI